MPVINNFSAWVQVDNQPLPEYHIEYSPEGTKATCWIPSESGKEFQICYRDEHRTKTTATLLVVDGTRCSGKIIYSKQSKRMCKSTAVHNGITVSETTLRPYIFSNCHLVEDESEQLVGDLSALGDIKLDIDEVQVGSASWRRAKAGFPVLQIHEKAKKAVVHGTQLGNVVSRPGKPARKTKRIQTLVSFVFRYRPLAVLMADGIAPRVTPIKHDPAASSSKSIDFIDLTVDDDLDSSTSSRARRNTKRVKTEVKRERSITYDDSIIDLTI